jgi:hypothetical protein
MKCKVSFEESDGYFYYNKKQDKYYGWCKYCHKKRVSDRAKRKRYTQKHRVRPLSSDPIEEKFIKMHRSVVQRHKNKQHSGEVVTTKELISKHQHQNNKCYYTGLDYKMFERGPLCISIDRVDNTKGYTNENTVLCCYFVNIAKNQWPLKQMKELWKHLPVSP